MEFVLSIIIGAIVVVLLLYKLADRILDKYFQRRAAWLKNMSKIKNEEE